MYWSIAKRDSSSGDQKRWIKVCVAGKCRLLFFENSWAARQMAIYLGEVTGFELAVFKYIPEDEDE